MRPNQGAPLIAASAGRPPPLPRHHSVSSISQGSSVQLIGSARGANAAEGIGIGITTDNTAAIYRSQSTEPPGLAPPISQITQQGQPAPRRPIGPSSSNNNNAYRDNRGQSQQQQPPPHQSPQQLQVQNNSNNHNHPHGTSQISSLTGSISRRISLRNSKSGSPHQPQGQFPHTSAEHIEPPEHHSGAVSRPHSMHPTTPVLIEEESNQYNTQRAATDVDSQFQSLQRVDSFGNQLKQQPQQGFQQQQQPPYYQGQQKPQQQQQLQQQQQQMPQPRPSIELQNSSLQHQQVSQLQGMQPQYGNQQPGSPLPPPTPGQQGYQQGQAPAYDPSKFNDQPMGRMTPPLNPPQQQQLPPQQGGQPPSSSHNQSSAGRTGALDIGKMCDDYDNLRMNPRSLYSPPSITPLVMHCFSGFPFRVAPLACIVVQSMDLIIDSIQSTYPQPSMMFPIPRRYRQYPDSREVTSTRKANDYPNL